MRCDDGSVVAIWYVLVASHRSLRAYWTATTIAQCSTVRLNRYRCQRARALLIRSLCAPDLKVHSLCCCVLVVVLAGVRLGRGSRATASVCGTVSTMSGSASSHPSAQPSRLVEQWCSLRSRSRPVSRMSEDGLPSHASWPAVSLEG